jgi:hypothetical protein
MIEIKISEISSFCYGGGAGNDFFQFNSKNNYYTSLNKLEYTKKGSKVGGQAQNDSVGGVYKYSEYGANEKLILIKKGRNAGETISEYIASELFNIIIPNNAAKVFLVNHPNNSSDLLIGSIFFEGFVELFKIMGDKERKKIFENKEKRSELVNLFKGSNLAKILVASLWLGDYDVHSGNIGAIDWDDSSQESYNYVTTERQSLFQRMNSTSSNRRGIILNQQDVKAINIFRKVFVKIDHGWSFGQIQSDVNLNQTPWGLRIGKPTNHFGDYSELYKTTSFKEAINDLISIPDAEITKVLDKSFEVIEYFLSQIRKSNESVYSNMLVELANWIGYKDKNYNLKKICAFLKIQMLNRKLSFKNLKLE